LKSYRQQKRTTLQSAKNDGKDIEQDKIQLSSWKSCTNQRAGKSLIET